VEALDGGMADKLETGEYKYKYELDFGGRKFDLYQWSHLDFGLMAARETIHKTLIADLEETKGADKSWTTKPITHPCFSVGMSKEITVNDKTYNFTGPANPSPAQCRNLAEKILHKDAACAIAPCSFNGIYQPPLSKTFAKSDLYIFSYFYDRTKLIGMPDSFTIREMHDLAETVCQGEQAWGVFESVPTAMEELSDRPEHCLDLNFMMALLHTGYEMPIDREVNIAKKIKGNELGWCLGASLPLLEANSGWQCKVTQLQ
jgi:guanosine-diphosphatase